MNKPLWSGNRPKTEKEARQQLAKAALACVKKLGLERTSMSDIAKEAGVTRPTLYKYYKSKTDVFLTGMDYIGLEFAESIARHVSRFRSAEKQIIEGIIYIYKEFPQHEFLPLAFDPECNLILGSRAFSDEMTSEFMKIALKPVIDANPLLEIHADEVGEMISRIAISLILFPGRYKESDSKLRAFLKRRVVANLL